jgi:hypothetical protein
VSKKFNPYGIEDPTVNTNRDKEVGAFGRLGTLGRHRLAFLPGGRPKPTY